MTTIAASPSSIDVSSLKKLNIDPSSVKKLTPEEIEKFKKIQEQAYMRPVNLAEHVSQKTYAEVKVNGKTVATLYNSGAVASSNAIGAQIGNLDSVKNPQGTGPDLAQQRAEDIAAALGGTVVKSSTAVTPAQYAAAPPIQYRIDYAAMEQDRKDADARAASATTKVNTQIIAQTPDGEAAKTITTAAVQTEETKAAGESAKDEFMKFANMSWQDKVRAMILKSMGLKEEDLANMSPEERAKIEQKIKDKIQAEIEKKTGISATGAAAAATAA